MNKHKTIASECLFYQKHITSQFNPTTLAVFEKINSELTPKEIVVQKKTINKMTQWCHRGNKNDILLILSQLGLTVCLYL